MRQRLLPAVLLLLAFSSTARAEQTLVFFRHAEKPSGGYGQITCQGFNRSLALPTVLTAKFGKPNYLYAPNPGYKISDPAGTFYYVRPLATIEPLAIKLGLSVNTNYAYYDIAGLRNVLITATKADSTLFIAWEHAYLVKEVQDIMNRYGGGVIVPAWATGDYDSIYVVRVNYVNGVITARFERDAEGLNGQPTTCPY
jgi:hypothetical protein